MATKPNDLTSPPDLTGHSKGTGALRTQRPVYMDFLPPCNNACPAGENIQAWMAEAQAGNHQRAWEILMDDNPLPAVLGRICHAPCENGCNRTFIDTTVNIHAVERFLGDKAIEEKWQTQLLATGNGKRVLIVGAGPSGLSAAYHLTRMGHKVVIHEAGPVAGGMMHLGIPAYRLPREVLNAEIERILDMGVEIVLNHKVSDILAEKVKGNFDAVFVAVGAHISENVDIPQNDAVKILDALSFLKDVDQGNPPTLGRRVAIYGGGDVAMDAARTAVRLGYEPYIIYRRDRKRMPAKDSETEGALTEGVKINWLRSIREIDQTEFKVEIMELDKRGKPQPTGTFETLEADALIMAVGQRTDTAFLSKIPEIKFKKDGTVVVGRDMATGYPGIFAGGDMVPGKRSVALAIGHGKKAAKNIDAYLQNTSYEKPPKHKIAGYKRLHMWYATEAPPKTNPELPVEDRIISFVEVSQGLEEAAAVYEAKRCLSCGNCFECDACYGSCPEDAIIKLGPGQRYEYNYDLCTGCAVCYEGCPCHAIEMIPEPTNTSNPATS